MLDTWDPSFKNWGASAAGPVDGFYRLTRTDDEGGGQTVVPVAQPFAGKVWLVVDASNSSATFEFAQIVQREHLGTLIGSATGGNQRGINGGAFFFVRLPRTGLDADLPLIGQFPSRAALDAGLEPDLLVETTALDIAAGRDPIRARLNSLWAGTPR